ncbi:HD domain-containing protein [Ureaplasma canigenitalium]|uniref:HD domain-containing protein n=1 Tax=Ureaplasma canigenitalium TaxID=42092 RepID=UPI0004E1C985|nr:HD domain-containing protein [Ureaplasma canigenitalium]
MNSLTILVIILIILFSVATIIIPMVVSITLKIQKRKFIAVPINKKEYDELENDVKLLQYKLETDVIKINELQDKMQAEKERANKAEEFYQTKMNEEYQKLIGLSYEQIKDELFKNARCKFINELNQEFIRKRKEFMMNYEREAGELLLDVIRNKCNDISFQETNTRTYSIDEKMRGKLFGEKCSNKNHFVKIAGVDFDIKGKGDHSRATISSYDLKRLTIADRALSEIINSKNNSISTIEKTIRKYEESYEEDMVMKGQEIATELNLNVPFELYSYIGKMEHRTSYGQSLLTHSIECAEFAFRIAKALNQQYDINVDPDKAKLAAFLHDIGKTYNIDQNIDHVDAGVRLAKQCNLDEEIVNAIEAHHDKVPHKTIIGAIVKVADSISSSRPLARKCKNEEPIQLKVEKIKSIVGKHKHIKDVFIMRFGEEIRVIVDSDFYCDIDLHDLATAIKKEVDQNFPGSKNNIEVVIVREVIYRAKHNYKDKSYCSSMDDELIEKKEETI